jgi:hypothetical protein
MVARLELEEAIELLYIHTESKNITATKVNGKTARLIVVNAIAKLGKATARIHKTNIWVCLFACCCDR